MTNTLGGYDLTIFVQEALRFLRLRLGMAGRVHRGYDPTPQQKGSTIRIPARGRFVVQDAPSSVQDIDAGMTSVPLDSWKEVKFALPDDEGQYAMDTIIEDHIEPAAYALASHINSRLFQEYRNVPWAVDMGADEVAAIVAARKRLADNGAPLTDGQLYLGVDHTVEAALLQSDIFRTAQVVGGTANQGALFDGTLGRRFGLEIFADGVVPAHTSGTVVSSGADVQGALTAPAAKGATQIALGGLSGTQTIRQGDSLVIAGSTQRYVATADVTLAAGAATVPVYPALARDYDDGAVVTFENGTAAGVHAEAFSANIAFHRDAFCLASAPLQAQRGSQQAGRQGIAVETIVDEETRLALRGRMWYDPDNSRVVTALDILYGVKTLDPNLACLLRRAV